MGAVCSGSKKKQKPVEEKSNPVPPVHNPPIQQSIPPNFQEKPLVIEKPKDLLPGSNRIFFSFYRNFVLFCRSRQFRASPLGKHCSRFSRRPFAELQSPKINFGRSDQGNRLRLGRKLVGSI